MSESQAGIKELKMPEAYNVLVVDDEESIRKLASKELATSRRLISTAGSAKAARKKVAAEIFDVILLDIYLPDGDGLDLLAEFKKSCPETEILLITGYGSIENAVEAMRIGAYDFVTKPFQLDRLDIILEKAHQRARLQRENLALKSQEPGLEQELVGISQGLNQVRELVRKVAPSGIPVLLTGESGSGKDVAARAIHVASPRAEKPFVVKNCATLQSSLVRSELFGHCKGAFTGATQDQEGLLAAAHQGSMFLDEIGELPLDVQGSLLRVLETQTFRRVGSTAERKVDVRLIFATNRDLEQEVQAGRFSQALLHRINVFQIKMPALRQRKEDISLLAEHFLAKFCPEQDHVLSKRAMQCLRNYDWPGNVRELKNVLERALILCEDKVITEQDLPQEIGFLGLEEESREQGTLTLEEVQQQHIKSVLHICRGNQTQAARILGIDRKTLHRKLQEQEG
ncbi:MAG: sigma-54-dependent transcriptional regulator [Desulfohalobiaceae bacterium]